MRITDNWELNSIIDENAIIDEVETINITDDGNIESCSWKEGKEERAYKIGVGYFIMPPQTKFFRIKDKYYEVNSYAKPDEYFSFVNRIDYGEIVYAQYAQLSKINVQVSYKRLRDLIEKLKVSKYKKGVHKLIKLSKVCEKCGTEEAYKLFCMQIDYLRRWEDLHIDYTQKLIKHPNGCVGTFINLISWVWKFVVIDYTQEGKKFFFDSEKEAQNKFGKLSFALGCVSEMQDDVFLAYVGTKPEKKEAVLKLCPITSQEYLSFKEGS